MDRDSDRGRLCALDGGRRKQPVIGRKDLPLGVVALVFGGVDDYTLSISNAITQEEIAAVRRHMMDRHAVRGLAWCCEARCAEAAGLLHPLLEIEATAETLSSA
jgi:hypothetical protein